MHIAHAATINMLVMYAMGNKLEIVLTNIQLCCDFGYYKISNYETRCRWTVRLTDLPAGIVTYSAAIVAQTHMSIYL